MRGGEGRSAGIEIQSPSSFLAPPLYLFSCTVNYPTSAVEILDLLKEGVAILSGGRDKQGQSLITFPSQPKGYVYQRDSMRRVVQYLACIPT